jgi:hypothetical protein
MSYTAKLVKGSPIDFELVERSIIWLECNVGKKLASKGACNPQGRWKGLNVGPYWSHLPWHAVNTRYRALTNDHSQAYDGIEIIDGDGWCILVAEGYEISAYSCTIQMDDATLAVQYKLSFA